MWRGNFDNRCASFTWFPLFHPNDMCFKVKLLLPLFQNKSYIWWNFSQTSPNEPECCQKQCKCCCWWTTKSNNSLLLFNNWYLDSTASAHINAVLCAPVPSTQMAGFQWNWCQKFSTLLWTPQLAGKRLVRVMQCT